jgi:hypothetical protein
MTLDANGSLAVGGTTVVTNNGGITATTTVSGSVAATLAMRNAGTGNGSGTTLVFRGVSNASAEHDYAYVAGVADDTTAKTGSIRFSTTAGSSPVERARISSDGTFRVKGAGTAGSTDAFQVSGSAPADAARITSGGDLLVGTTSGNVGSYGKAISLAATASAYAGLEISGTTGGALEFQTSQSTRQVQLLGNSSGFIVNVNGGSGLAERARITSGGYFKASNAGTYNNSTGAYHELYSNASGDWIGYFTQATASNPNGVVIQYTAAAPNGTGNTFLYCNDNAAVRATIRSNGGLANYQSNNVDLSDARTKTDISQLSSYWNKIAGLEIVTYKYKDQTHDDLNIGVIAQQVEAVAPEFVDSDGFGETPEDGVPLKTIYNKDLTFAAIKALQEAMARIETLEAKIAVLESKGV